MQRILFAKVELWVVLAVILFGLLGLIFYGAAILEQTEGRGRLGKVGDAAVAVAGIPATAEKILKGDNPMQVYQKHRFEDQYGWSWADGATGTGLPGYYITSYHLVAEQRSVIDMVRLSDGKIVHSWKPDMDAILKDVDRSSKVANVFNFNAAKYNHYHPILQEDGGLITKATMTPLVRIDQCGAKVWVNDSRTFHHSTEPDGEGGYWSPTVTEPSSVKGTPETFLEDTLTHVTADGTIHQEISLVQVFLRHGMDYELFPPGAYADDPLHLNDIQPVLQDGPYWKKGDLFLSLRAISMVLLYRPSTDEIIWKQQGPWMGQHDVDILDDHRIALYDNRVTKRNNSAGEVVGHSDILIYDFATGEITRPFSQAMEREGVISLYEGLYTFLPGGALAVGDHNSGRTLFLAPDGGKLGQFINRNPDGKVYQVGWGRYVDQAFGDKVLQHMEANPCP